MSELTQLAVGSFIGPFIFIAVSIFIFVIFMVIAYYAFLRKFFSEKFALVLGFLVSATILYVCTENYEWVRLFVKNFI